MAKAKTIREFLVAIGIKADKKAIARVDAQLTKVKAGLGVVARGAAFATAAIVGTTAALFGIAVATARAGDEAAKMGKRIGLTAGEVQELSFAAEIAGASSADVEAGMRRLSKSASDSQRGLKTATDAFGDLGIEVEKAGGELKSPLELFLETADAMSLIDNDTKRAALAMEVFGRGGARLVPLLKEGRAGIEALREEARELGFVFDQEAAEAAEKFIDSQLEARKVLEGLRNTIGIALLPVLTDMIDGFTEWFKANRDVIKQRLERTAEQIADGFRTIGRVLRRVDRIVVERVGGWSRILLGVVAAIGVLLGLKALASLVTIIQAVIAAFGLMASVGAGPVAVIAAAIGAVVAAFGLLFLALDDLVVFLRGGDSALGEFIKRFGEGEDASESLARIMKAVTDIGVALQPVLADIGSTLMDVFGPALAVIVPLLQEFLAGFLTDKAKEILDFFEGLAIILEGVVTFLRLVDKLQRATPFDPSKPFATFEQLREEERGAGAGRRAVGAGPSSVGAGLGALVGPVVPAGAGGGANSTTTTVGDMNVTINAPGADAQEVARIVEEKDAVRRRQAADGLRGGEV